MRTKPQENMMKPPNRPTSPEEVDCVKLYESGFRDGHKAGHSDKLLKFRSVLYWTGRECAPSWYEQGYNDGYVQGRRP